MYLLELYIEVTDQQVNKLVLQKQKEKLKEENKKEKKK